MAKNNNNAETMNANQTREKMTDYSITFEGHDPGKSTIKEEITW